MAFLVDVVAVNDRAYEEANPLRRFERELWRRVMKARLPTNHFSYKVGAERIGEKPRLLLPRDHRWEILFDENFDNFLKWAIVQPDTPIGLHRKTEEIDVTFWYTPGQQFGGGSYSSYRESSSMTKNPILNALKRKKDQLKASGYAGIKGIIVCDAGCKQLSATERIVQRFLRDTTSIAFVIVCTIDGDRFSHAPIRVRARAFPNPRVTSEEVARNLKTLFERRFTSVLPDATDDITNALNHLQGKHRASAWVTMVDGVLGETSTCEFHLAPFTNSLPGRCLAMPS